MHAIVQSCHYRSAVEAVEDHRQLIISVLISKELIRLLWANPGKASANTIVFQLGLCLEAQVDAVIRPTEALIPLTGKRGILNNNA